MKKWARFLKRARDEEQKDRLNLAIVAANNHYAGFGPRTANTFRKNLVSRKYSFSIQSLIGVSIKDNTKFMRT